MIFYILFGKFEGDLIAILENSELIKKLTLKENIDPNMLFGMANALFSIGTELQGGKLKTLDLKNFSIITNGDEKNLLVLVVDNSKKYNSRKTILIEKIINIFNLFMDYHDKNNINQESFDDLIKSLKKNIPTFKKSIKHLKLKK